MTCLLIGMILKLVGIVVALPNAWANLKRWKDKESAKLWEANSVYQRRGTRAPVPAWKKLAYRITRMPHRHLWDFK